MGGVIYMPTELIEIVLHLYPWSDQKYCICTKLSDDHTVSSLFIDKI